MDESATEWEERAAEWEEPWKVSPDSRECATTKTALYRGRVMPDEERSTPDPEFFPWVHTPEFVFSVHDSTSKLAVAASDNPTQLFHDNPRMIEKYYGGWASIYRCPMLNGP